MEAFDSHKKLMKELIIIRGLNSTERHTAAANVFDYKVGIGYCVKYINRKEFRSELILQKASPLDLKKLCFGETADEDIPMSSFNLEEAIQGTYRNIHWDVYCREAFWTEVKLQINRSDCNCIILEGGFILMQDLREIERIQKFENVSILIIEVSTNTIPDNLTKRQITMLLKKLDEYREKLSNIVDEYIRI